MCLTPINILDWFINIHNHELISYGIFKRKLNGLAVIT